MTKNKTLDDYFPYRGRCGLCGGPDARHRTVDVIKGRYKAGDSIKEIAHDLAIPKKAIILAIKTRRTFNKRIV